MADDTTSTGPLLQPQAAADPPEPGAKRCASAAATATLDDMIERCVGSIGAVQLFQAVLVSVAWLFDAQQTFINVFTDAAPSWHCTGHVDDAAAAGACSQELLPGGPCGLPAGRWAWDRHPRASVISEWSLECAGPSVTGLPASAHFAGCLAGGFALATLADSTLGRKKMLLFSCLGMSVAGLLTAASPNVWVYSALRFAGGFARSTIGGSALVLSTELVGKKWRSEVGIIGFLCFTLGFLSLPAMAYANRNSSWRYLYLWTSVPALLYSVLVHFLVRESPRWLLVRGRRDEAVEALKHIAAANGKDVLAYSFSGFRIEGEQWSSSSVDLYSALRVLLEKPWALRRLAAAMTAGFGIGMVYYGMPLALGSLGSDLYLSVAVNAVSELPSSLVTFFLIGRINRRAAVLGFTLASGAGSVACAFLEGGAVVGVEVVSFFSACTAFDVLLIYALELFPTCVRNSALSMVRQALVLGGVFAPLLVAAAAGGRGKGGGGRFTSFGVFGLVIACCGLFVLGLPETRGGGICDTLEEQEYKDKSTAAAAADNPLA